MTDQEKQIEFIQLTEKEKEVKTVQFKDAVQRAYNAKEDAKASNTSKKSFGVTISTLIIEAFVFNINAIHDDIKLNMGWNAVTGVRDKELSQTPAYIAIKQYISRAYNVGADYEKGLFTREELLNCPMTTLYDKRKARKEEAETIKKALTAKAVADNEALLAVYGTQDKVNEFVLSPEYAMQVSEKLVQGNTILAEQESEQARITEKENMGKTVTDTKAWLITLQREYPEYFTEVKNHLLGLLETPKSKKSKAA